MNLLLGRSKERIPLRLKTRKCFLTKADADTLENFKILKLCDKKRSAKECISNKIVLGFFNSTTFFRQSNDRAMCNFFLMK